MSDLMDSRNNWSRGASPTYCASRDNDSHDIVSTSMRSTITRSRSGDVWSSLLTSRVIEPREVASSDIEARDIVSYETWPHNGRTTPYDMGSSDTASKPKQFSDASTSRTKSCDDMWLDGPESFKRQGPGHGSASAKKRKDENVPRICIFHNTDKGCKCGDSGKGCPYMHICSRFIKYGSCKFTASVCRYSHSLLKPQVKAILYQHGYTVKQETVKTLLPDLREAFRTQENKFATSLSKSSDGVGDEGRHTIAAAKAERDIRKWKREETEICSFYLRDKCIFKETCGWVHCDLPYQWEYQEREKWVPFSSKCNQEIETAFCDRNRAGVSVRFLDSVDSPLLNIEFKEMKCSGCDEGPVRRLSTQSWGKANKNRPFITKWTWYWMDEHHTWGAFEKSCDIEEKYCDGESDYKFRARGFDYVLSFREMKQKNTLLGTEREVRRRPLLYTKPEQASTHEDAKVGEGGIGTGWLHGTVIPDTWDMTGISGVTDVKTVELDATCHEYLEVKKRFHSTMSNHNIKSIERIQNVELWQEYMAMKQKMLRKKTGSKSTALPSATQLSHELKEQLLFHGTRQHLIEPIYSQRGFDFRLAGTSVGTKYGKGNYFARDAKYSSDYAEGKTMFVVRVLVGEYTRGKPKFSRPPPRDPSEPYGNLYDTCVDDVRNPSIFVTFEFGQSYPAYLLQYI